MKTLDFAQEARRDFLAHPERHFVCPVHHRDGLGPEGMGCVSVLAGETQERLEDEIDEDIDFLALMIAWREANGEPMPATNARGYEACAEGYDRLIAFLSPNQEVPREPSHPLDAGERPARTLGVDGRDRRPLAPLAHRTLVNKLTTAFDGRPW